MKKRLIIFLIIVILLVPNIYAFTSNSSNYKLILTTVSDGGADVNSSSYKNIISLGIINWIINSTNYISKLGFLHGLMLADGQPCSSANQCEGGYCCSSECASSSCPTEEPEEAAAAAGEGAGGGGIVNRTGLLALMRDYSVNPSSIKAEIVIGRSETKELIIKNKGIGELDFSLSVVGVEDFVSLSEDSFSLGIDESKTIILDIYGKDFGAYSGKIVINGDDAEKTVPIVIEVKSDLVLFDVKIDIPTAYKEVGPGSDLKAQITLLNVGAPKKVDVFATYLMKDFTGNVIYESSETFAVDRQKSFVKTFPISKYIAPEDYLAVVEVRYSNSFAVSSEMFKVVEKPFVTLQKLLKMPLPNLILMIIVLVGILILFISKLLPKSFSRRKE